MSEVEQKLILTEEEKKEIELKEILGWHKPGTRPLKPRYMSDEEARELHDKQWKERHGYTYTEWLARRASEPASELERRQKQAMAEGLPPEELPEHMEPDEYYDWKANYRGEPADEIDYSSGYGFEDF
ncbi:MAG: hypothetical protein SVX43_01285 [Cyanobacteriota bacterium]|nr:hypothetical protein [Cyanobacteriota bacterium]